MQPHSSCTREHLERLGIAGLLAVGAAGRGYAANETIGVGVIGCGGRARRQLMPSLKTIPGVRLVGLCDVYDAHLKAGKVVAGDPGIFTTVDHRELLSRREVDAVVIATPDHWHVPMLVDACGAGKDVYVEKPLTHKVEEGQAAIDAVRNHRCVVQVGTQQRSMPQFWDAKRMIDEGRLGPIRKIRMAWNRNFLPYSKPRVKIKPEQIDWKRFCGNAPEQPFDAYRMRDWRWFWDFGNGILTDLMVHWLDAAVWLAGLGDPTTVIAAGDNFATAGVWQTPDTIQATLRYADRGIHAYFEGSFLSTNGKAHMEVLGEKGTIYLDRGRWEFHPEKRHGGEYAEKVIGTEPRGSDFFKQPDGELLHVGNWVESMRSRRDPHAPIEDGVRSAAAAHLANRACRENQLVEQKRSF